MRYKGIIYFFITILFMSVFYPAIGQLSAPGSSATIQTEYTAFPEADNIFIFCSISEGVPAGSLQVQTALAGTKTYLWEKYNPASGIFDFYSSESTEEMQSTVSNLEDGGYRVTVTQGETSETFRAWVFTSQITAGASVISSTCESFTLQGEFTSAPFVYYDPANNSPLDVFQDMKVEWLQGEMVVGGMLEQTVFNPPSADTEYALRVYNRFGCETTASLTYISIVPKASFTADPMEGEAPLTVTFTNTSENADPDLYEWFFYRDLDDIKRESESTQQPIDSIMIVAYDQSPVYTYENTGLYKVKLVAKKTSGSQVCADTAFLADFIKVDTSFVAVPNVFTPDGDGTNDEFVVKFWSMESLNISIFNRWGKRIHFWESNNVRGFEESYTSAVWDGTIGGRHASPGVYYYIVEGRGRDNKTRKAHGFFHLFRGNN
jgi:gliding motility-associated-like protein